MFEVLTKRDDATIVEARKKIKHSRERIPFPNHSHNKSGTLFSWKENTKGDQRHAPENGRGKWCICR